MQNQLTTDQEAIQCNMVSLQRNGVIMYTEYVCIDMYSSHT